MLRIVPGWDRTTRECVDASPREYRASDSNSLSGIYGALHGTQPAARRTAGEAVAG